MNIRAAHFCLVVAFVFAIGVSSARAQGQGGPPPGTIGGQLQTLSAKIAALQAQLSALTSGQGALETRVNALETIDFDDAVGTYQFLIFGIELNSAFPPSTPARISPETSSFTITLNADGTAVFNGTDAGCTLAAGQVTCHEQPGEGSTTWSYANGVVTIDDPEEPLIFPVTPSGVLGFAGTSPFQPGHGWSNIGLLVKVS